MPKPVRLSNGKHWSKQKDALEHFKGMLSRYAVGQRIDAVDDHDDLCALLQGYDAVLLAGAETKIGCGISHFSKRQNTGDGWVTAGFHVHRTDGSHIDFSYIDAVKASAG